MFVWQLHSISCLLTMSILFLRNLLYLIKDWADVVKDAIDIWAVEREITNAAR